MKVFLRTLKQAGLIAAACMVLCGVIYPMALTGVSQLLFPKQANGSIIQENGKAIGSSLIGQQFTDERFLQGRISSVNYNTYSEADTVEDAQGNTAYSGPASGSSNYAASNPDLKSRVETDMETFLKKHPDVKKDEIPADLMTGSGSGLDPHISVKAAQIQVPAIAKAAGLSEDKVREFIEQNTQKKVLGIFGEETVNVLKVNIEIAKEIGVL